MYEHSANHAKNLQLVELGPGRGTLMKDMIRVRKLLFFKIPTRFFLIFKVLRKRNYSNTNTSFALYEASPLMRKRQAETLLGQSVEIESFD